MLGRYFWSGLVAASLVVTLGCETGPPQDPTTQVTGQVTLNGEPVEAGTISYVGADDRQQGRPSASGEIKNGTYTAQVRAGTKQVQIRAPRESGSPDVTGLVPTVESIPAKYSQETELEVDIFEQGPQQEDLELRS